ncbi:MAG TPA: NAD(P)/FAD-dependent oxidoreductase [Methylocella sp.]|nr:NAD(P)/FAD-dependent oxidoreductase [Methylocella sp.]
MSADLKADLCVVGGGAGGVSLALGAAAGGLSVVLIEKAALGGRRLTHTVPRHALLAVSRASAASRAAVDFGAAPGEPPIDFARGREHIASVVAAIAPNYAQARLEAMNVKVIRAAGRFTRPDTCEAGGRKIIARRFVVATGAIGKAPPIPGLDLVRPLDSASLCTLDRPPRCLIVIGADPDGLALAQAMRRFGCVVIVIADTKVFALDDDELTAPVRAAFARDGIVLHEGARISRIEPRADGVRVFIVTAGQEKPITGSHLLIAAGRLPVVEGLGLAEARVRYNKNGIETGTGFTTSNRRIHAIGAVIRGAQHDGAAEQHAGLVLRAVLGLPGGRMRRPAAARVVLTCPPIAVTGLSEAQARAAYRHIHVLRWPFPETERARIEHHSGGHIKLLASRRGAILGAGIVGVGAEELINLCTLAISTGMTASDIASIMVTYPALTDAVRRAGMTFPANRLDGTFTQLMLSVQRWFAQGLP